MPGLDFISFFILPVPKAPLSCGLPATSMEDARESLFSLDTPASEPASLDGSGELVRILLTIRTSTARATDLRTAYRTRKVPMEEREENGATHTSAGVQLMLRLELIV